MFLRHITHHQTLYSPIHRSFAKTIPNFRKYGQVRFDFKKIIENISLIEQNCVNR